MLYYAKIKVIQVNNIMFVFAVLISATLCSIRVINPFSEVSLETTLSLPVTQYYPVSDKFTHAKMAFVAGEEVVIPFPADLKHCPLKIIKETHPTAFNTHDSCVVTKAPLRFKSQSESLVSDQTVFIQGLLLSLDSSKIKVFQLENTLIEADSTQFSKEFQSNTLKTRQILKIKEESSENDLIGLLTEDSIQIFKVVSTTGKTKTAIIPHSTIEGKFSDQAQVLFASNNTVIVDENVIMSFENNTLIHTELAEQPFIEADILGNYIYLVQSDKQLVKYSLLTKQFTRTGLINVVSVKTFISFEPIVLVVLTDSTEMLVELVVQSDNLVLNRVIATETETKIENMFCTSMLCYLSTSEGILLFPHSKPPNEHFNPIILPFTGHSAIFYQKNTLYLAYSTVINIVSDIQYPTYHLNCLFEETGDKTIKLKSPLTQCEKAVCSTQFTIFLSITSKSAHFFLYFLSLVIVFLIVGLILCCKDYFSNYDQIPQE